jgi:scyllo-inositol 2-dehydrogenase (NADP+)
MAAQPARVALIGFGLGGAVFHAPYIAAAAGLSLAAIVTGNPGRRAQAEREYPHAMVLGSAEELWARGGDFDLVVVATPNASHVPLTLAALDAGLAVVVDKPLAPSAAEARRLVGAAREREKLLTVFHNRRWDGDFLTLRGLIESGELGAVLRFESRYERWRSEIHPGWRENPDPAEGGGILIDLGSHVVDQALQLFGPPRHVYGELRRVRTGAQTDDDAFVAIEHKSGTFSHCWMSVVAAQPGPRFRVLGERAAFVYGAPAEVEEADALLGAGDELRTIPTPPNAWTRFYDGVAVSLRDGSPPPVDPADAILTLEVLEAARGVE